ncbi:MAG: NADH-ubiquinone oxidoreductase-F iron-sulfur binding region domain-containing protein, partial [Planctomycetota bacterium]
MSNQTGRPMSRDAVEIRVGAASCGVASGALAVAAAIEDEVRLTGADAAVKRVGCNGLCFAEPVVEVVAAEGTSVFRDVTPEFARRIVRRHAPPRGVVGRALARARDLRGLLSRDSAWVPLDARAFDTQAGPDAPFVAGQRKIALERCGVRDPVDVAAYVADGGYSALSQVLSEMKPWDVIDLVEKSGLRGRGGAGFPTARKWRITRAAVGDEKYVVCNGDEGDPGAFMDRALIESDPHRVIEGLAIAAYAVGAGEGYVYVRAEYPLAVERITAAIAEAERAGWLGSNIRQSGFDLRLHVFVSAGAFVCGEETALISSIEGRRGNPSMRPPYPAERGLRGKPTLVNNVETLACVPWIVSHGPDEFARLGTATSKGTKVFALAGQVRRGGLVEVPMGMTIREIVFDIGGGIPDDREFKAVQIGGPSGGCLPASLADTPIDFDELTATGAIMGSGGLVVLDETACMVDFARFFLPFMLGESCGKCTFCRIGLKRMLEIIDRLCEGRAERADLDRLTELGQLLKDASFCGLGKSAPNPVLTSLRYFREEYEAHVDGR